MMLQKCFYILPEVKVSLFSKSLLNTEEQEKIIFTVDKLDLFTLCEGECTIKAREERSLAVAQTTVLSTVHHR